MAPLHVDGASLLLSGASFFTVPPGPVVSFYREERERGREGVGQCQTEKETWLVLGGIIMAGSQTSRVICKWKAHTQGVPSCVCHRFGLEKSDAYA